MLANIMGSFIGVLIGFTVMKYAWGLPTFWQRLPINALGLFPIFIGGYFFVSSLKSAGLFEIERRYDLP